MSEIKTLEDMRNTVKTIAADCDEGWILECLDAIEAEIAERFIELPVDADGMMLEIGDKLEYRDETMTLCGLIWDGADWYATNVYESTSWKPVRRCHHVKPRTLESVLQEYGSEIADSASKPWSEIVDKYAAEIREVLGVDK